MQTLSPEGHNIQPSFLQALHGGHGNPNISRERRPSAKRSQRSPPIPPGRGGNYQSKRSRDCNAEYVQSGAESNGHHEGPDGVGSGNGQGHSGEDDGESL